MEVWILLAMVFAAAIYFVFGKESEHVRRKREAEEAINRLKREEEEYRTRKAAVIRMARDEAEELSLRGAIFEITTNSSIRGYHVKELGWLVCEKEERSAAEDLLRLLAAKKYKEANVLTKLSHSVRSQPYQAGTGHKGNPYYRNMKIKTWEAMACEAIPNRQVDKSPKRWNPRIAVIDGSNVAHWDRESGPNLAPVKAVVQALQNENVKPIVLFDANIGFKIASRFIGTEEIQENLGECVDIEVVEAGTVADYRIIELAEKNQATVITNDLFRDSLRARLVPKRRGFFIAEYGHVELLQARP